MKRILLTKPTHHCHDRGVRYLAKRFRDESFEVVFTNFLLPAEIVATAVQEDVQVIGISSSSGGHVAVFEGGHGRPAAPGHGGRRGNRRRQHPARRMPKSCAGGASPGSSARGRIPTTPSRW